MTSRETFTLDEITEVFREIEVDFFLSPYFDDGVGSATINCEIGPIHFFCNLQSQSPFFDGLSLRAFRYDVENCLVFANRFNSNFPNSHAAVKADDNGVAIVDEDQETCVYVECFIHFFGGVTTDHIRYLFELWIEELIDFFEIDLDLDESREEIDVEVPQSPEFLEMPLIERISAYLSLNSSSTAREMGRVLLLDRHEINSVLYKHRDRFVKSGEQPPRWSIKSAVSS
jgi:hypothetical protein